MELKPCPKCGSDKINYLSCTDRLKCFSCGYKGPTAKSRTQAYEVWNNIPRDKDKGGS